MADRLRDVARHPAGGTALATAVGYGVILAGMTVVLFGGAWALFRLFG